MGTTLYKVFDASQPPNAAPGGAEGVLGYVGRQGETPHIWTPAEWNRFSHLRMFPAWVPDTTNTPAQDAKEAVMAIERLGWARYPEPDTRAIVLDGETSQFPGWYEAWANEVTADGYFPVDYGSYSFVSANFAYEVWAADWDGIPALVPGQTVGGTQYKANIPFDGTEIDLSVIDFGLFRRGGQGKRHG